MIPRFRKEIVERWFQPDPSTIQDLVAPVLDGCPSLHQNLPVSRKVPKLAIASEEDLGRLDQAVESKLGDPLGIFKSVFRSGILLIW